MPRRNRHSCSVAGPNDPSPSSEEDEDDFQVDTPCPPPSPNPLDIAPVSCHDISIRTAICDAYCSVARIYNPSYWPYLYDAPEPWSQLGDALKDLRRWIKHGRSSALDVQALTRPLLLILLHEVIPVAKSKQARRSSMGLEASGIDTILKQWPVLSTLVVELEDRKVEKLLSTDKSILWCFAFYALNPNGTLYLKEMPPGSLAYPCRIDFSLFVDLLKIPTHTVTTLDLRDNDLDHIPIQWVSTFPRIRSLDIKRNRISHLPIYHLRTQIDLMWWEPVWSTKILPENSLVVFGSFPLQPRPSHCRSLESYCLSAIYQAAIPQSTLLEVELPDRIREIITYAYTCEICDQDCAAYSVDWLTITTMYRAFNTASTDNLWRKYIGRLYRPCVVFLLRLRVVVEAL